MLNHIFVCSSEKEIGLPHWRKKKDWGLFENRVPGRNIRGLEL